jgi:hypothetical protein
MSFSFLIAGGPIIPFLSHDSEVVKKRKASQESTVTKEEGMFDFEDSDFRMRLLAVCSFRIQTNCTKLSTKSRKWEFRLTAHDRTPAPSGHVSPHLTLPSRHPLQYCPCT